MEQVKPGAVQVKVVFMGSQGVGKTTFIHTVVSAKFVDDVEPTVGVDYFVKGVNVYGTHIRMDVWDMSGNESFSGFGPMIYANAQAVAVMFDSSDRSTWNRAVRIVNEVRMDRDHSDIVLIGSKREFADATIVHDTKRFAELKGLTCHFVSAKEDNWECIRDIVVQIGELALKRVVYASTNNAGYEAPVSAPPPWQPDSSTKACSSCRTEFTLANRRHHCRSCGYIFCHACSSQCIALPQYGIRKEVRVCAACFKRAAEAGKPAYMAPTPMSPLFTLGADANVGRASCSTASPTSPASETVKDSAPDTSTIIAPELSDAAKRIANQQHSSAGAVATTTSLYLKPPQYDSGAPSADEMSGYLLYVLQESELRGATTTSSIYIRPTCPAT